MAEATVHPNHQLISSEDVEGTSVYSPNRDEIGSIDHLMIDKRSGKISYAVMSFGGFMGLGHSHYPIPWAALRYDKSLEGFMTNVTEAQLRDAPAFSDDSWEGWIFQPHSFLPYPSAVPIVSGRRSGLGPFAMPNPTS